ncbi:MAG: hypothetical protein O9301_07790 [Leptospira sp.]|nr:hypothetical protein [Leptospira sp.]
MAQHATQVFSASLEQEAWDLYEVGSTEELVQLTKNHPDSYFLQHLGYLATYELTGKVVPPTPKGISPLSPIVEAILNFQLGKQREAAAGIALYFKNPSNPICFSLLQIGIKVFFSVESYSEAKYILDTYKSKTKDTSFVKEEVTCLYYLKRYEEAIKLFREHIKSLNDPEIHKLVGLSLLFLDKHKEASLIFENLPGKLNLPSFEDKKKSYQSIYSQIQKLEEQQGSLTQRELEDMGFAYLFHGDYEKAEKLFSSLSQKLKSKLCTA